jgi:hypothetical protein
VTLYAWPPRTTFGRVIPKSRIYEGAAVPRAGQAKFVEQIERMEWTHVLRADTLNLRPSKNVEEIAVIAIALHTGEVEQAVLSAIEKAIPRPLILELSHSGRTRMVAAWKRPNLAEAGKWVTSSHVFGPWQSANAPRQALPAALDLAPLYAGLLDPLLPAKHSPDESIADRVARAEEAAQLSREIVKLKAGLKREKQFNRKVELNAALRAANARHAALTSGTRGN